ncbi:MAG: dihydropteroate synthase [bacterium]
MIPRLQYTLKLHDRELILGQRTLIMGILNITPDSFSDGGLFFDHKKALKQAHAMIEEGADIIDVGGESTRPQSEPVTCDDEIERVIPVIKQLRKETNVPISIDTYKSEVAKRALDCGAHIVNDISGLNFDSNMAHVISEYNASVVVMHIKGTPSNMQKNPVYTDLIGEIRSFFKNSLQLAMNAAIPKERCILDVGIGFGKTTFHNLELIKRLGEFHDIGCPILIGLSRKSFIGNVLDLPVDQRLEGTAAGVTTSILHGAHIVRVHDVGFMGRVARMTDAFLIPENY